MSNNINPTAIKKSLRKVRSKVVMHLTFVVTVVVLFSYVFIVWRINELTTAEPTPDQENATLSASKLPIIDKKAIEKIQALEESSPDIKSFFNEARNNPFDE